MDAARRISKGTTEVGRSVRAAIRLLHEGLFYAQDVDLPPWDFAVEIQRLRDAKVTNSDLRWLVAKGYVEHADELTSPCQNGRTFRPIGNLTLSESACFVLTVDGIDFAELIGVVPTIVLQDQAISESNGQSLSPKVVWDPDRRRLCLDGKVVKQYHVPAPNQELILSAFQEEGWPPRVDDPLPPSSNTPPKQHLHTTINSLNRNQKNRLIRFRGDGNGEGICWEIVRDGKSGK